MAETNAGQQTQEASDALEKKELHAQIKLMITADDDRKGPSFGKGAAILLQGIEQNGSLNKTAKSLGMAYSKAWSMIKKVEEGLGFQLINRYGARGSKLTDEGHEFLVLYLQYERLVEDYAAKTFEEVFKDW